MSKIYIYDFSRNAYTHCFENLEEVIEFLVRHTHYAWWSDTKLGNTYLDLINMNGSDTFITSDINNAVHLRPYMFVDEYMRILDMREYWEEIKKRYKNAENVQEIKEKSAEKVQEIKYGDVLEIGYFYKMNFRYRIDPVPYIHKKRFGNFLRNPKTFQETRENDKKEYEKYVRGKRKRLPTVYDEFWRSNGRNKSWKNQKIKKQWQKHNQGGN